MADSHCSPPGWNKKDLIRSLVNKPQRVDGDQQPGKIDRRASEFFAAISSQFCPGVRQTGGLEVSIVALICIHNTLSPLFSLPMPPYSGDIRQTC